MTFLRYTRNFSAFERVEAPGHKTFSVKYVGHADSFIYTASYYL